MSDERLYLGTGDGDGWGFARRVKVYARAELEVVRGDKFTVQHEPIRDPMRFSLTFDLVAPSGRELGGGAMGLDGLAEVTERGAASDVFVALAQLVPWHLNDVNAACVHQTVVYETGPYGQQPSLKLTEPCPVTGYRYGSAWLVNPLTVEVLELARSVGCVVPVGGTVFNDGVATTKGGCVP